MISTSLTSEAFWCYISNVVRLSCSHISQEKQEVLWYQKRMCGKGDLFRGTGEPLWWSKEDSHYRWGGMHHEGMYDILLKGYKSVHQKNHLIRKHTDTDPREKTGTGEVGGRMGEDLVSASEVPSCRGDRRATVPPTVAPWPDAWPSHTHAPLLYIGHSLNSHPH